MQTSQNSEHFQFSINLDQFDQFLEAVRGWDLDFIKLDRGSFKGQLNQLISVSFHFGRVRLDSILDQSGQPPEGMRSMVIPANPHQNIHWRGFELTGSEIGIWPIGSELNAQSRNGFDVFVISFLEDRLDQICDLMELPRFTILTKGQECLKLPRQEMERLRNNLKVLNKQVFSNQNVNAPLLLPDEIADIAAHNIIGALASDYASKVKSELRFRELALDRALNYISLHADKAPKMIDIYKASFASERTIQYAFMERFGITAKQYLKATIFNSVNRELLKADPSNTLIKPVAERWGFSHMSGFSADYKQFFGETPSQTLQKRTQ